jgi:hypothetical protein
MNDGFEEINPMGSLIKFILSIIPKTLIPSIFKY